MHAGESVAPTPHIPMAGLSHFVCFLITIFPLLPLRLSLSTSVYPPHAPVINVSLGFFLQSSPCFRLSPRGYGDASY